MDQIDLRSASLILLLSHFGGGGSDLLAQSGVEWTRCYGGTFFDWVDDIKPCPDGGFIVVGRTLSNDGDVTGNHDPAGHFTDIWMVKLDSAGLFQWQKCYGGFIPEWPARVAVTSDSGYVVAGAVTCGGNANDGDVMGCHGGRDGWVFRTDPSGNLLWQRCLGGSLDDEILDLVLLPDNSMVMVGDTKSNDGDVSGLHGNGPDIWLVKLDGQGTLSWQHCFDASNGNDYGRALVTGPGGTFTVLGERYYGSGCPWSSYEVWLFNADTLGNIHWNSCFGGNDFEYGKALLHAADGGYLVAGGTLSSDHDGIGNHDPTGTYYDVLAARTDSLGSIAWVKMLGGSQHDEGRHWFELPNGNLRLMGWSGSNDGDVTGNHGSDDAWVVEMDANGNLLGQQCYGGTYSESAMAMVPYADGAMVIAARGSSSDGDVQGIPGHGVDYWIFKVASMDISTAIGNGPASSPKLTAFQGSSTLHVHSSLPLQGMIVLRDAQGRIARSVRASGTDALIPVGDLAAGTYLVIWENNGVQLYTRAHIIP